MDLAKAATLTILLALAGCVSGPRTDRALDWSSDGGFSPPPSRPVVPPLVLSPTNAPAGMPPTSSQRDLPIPDEFHETWIPLNRLARIKGWESPSRFTWNGLPAYAMHTTQGRFAVQPGNSVAEWEGIQVHLGFPPQLIDNQPYLQNLDVRKTMAPLLAGGTPPWQKPNPVIVLDPGHGGADSGTRSVSGRLEKEFTLDWARRLREILLANGWKAYLTRDTDTDLLLTNRVAIADEMRADLFVSLHFNSTANGQEQSGLETYCLTPAGLPSNLTRGYEDVTTQAFPNNAYDKENILLATRLHRALLTGMEGLRDRGVRRARFLGVLRSQQRPAVLLEAGYLSNPAEARQVADPEYRQQLAEAVARGLIGRVDIAGLRAGLTQSRARGDAPSTGILSPAR
jgi:N-acetylmuramoyl-L-alanine amidase